MKKRQILKKKYAAALSAVMAAALLAGSISMPVRADSYRIKSQGNLSFNNKTPEDPSDDVVFCAEDMVYLYEKVNGLIETVTQGKLSLVQAVGQKGATVAQASDVPTFEELKNAVAAIGTGATASAGDVLKGKTIYNGTGYSVGTLELTGTAVTANVLAGTTFYGSSLNKQNGSMKNFAGQPPKKVPVTVNGTTASVKIPAAGYYDTASTLTFDASDIVNTLKLQGDASPEQVLSGRKFLSDSATVETGIMPDRAGTTQNAAIATSGNTGTVNIPAAGYYDTNAKLTVDLTANNNQKIEEGKAAGAYNVKKITLCDGSAGAWDGTTISGYEKITGDGTTYHLGVYNEVYVQVDGISATKYDANGTSGNMHSDSMFAKYDAASGNVVVDYGKSLYLGGGNYCHMTILYK